MDIIERRYLLGVDLAKSLDFTSFAVIEMAYEPAAGDYLYHLQGLDRIQGVDYPQIVKLILDTLTHLDKLNASGFASCSMSDGPHLCLDASGLGAPVRDYLKQGHYFTGIRRIYPVVFTGGEAARYDPNTKNYNISKTKIISNFLSLMQHRRFDYASNLQALPLLEEEIQNFQYHATPSGHIGMDAPPGKHDDLICAICIPLIIGEWKYRRGKVTPQLTTT